MAVEKKPRAGDVLVVVNANARRFVENRSLLVDLDRLIDGRASLRVTRSRQELREAARDARDADARVVVLCGGDGSYGAGATAIAEAYGDRELPILALAPGGTVGTVARSLGVAAGGAPIHGIARVLHAAIAGAASTLETPTLSVRFDDDRRIGFIFGTGLVASFFELYDPRAAEATDAPSGGAGSAAAAKIVARIFAESFVSGPIARKVLTPLRCDVRVDGELLPWTGSSLVVASVLQNLGIGMRVTHRGAEDPLRPHVVVSGLAPGALGPRLPRVLRGLPIGDPGEPHFDGLVNELAVSFPDEGPFVIDGDLRRAKNVSVTAGPRLSILCPPP
jgi:diacylglycerol kinase (ATP)